MKKPDLLFLSIALFSIGGASADGSIATDKLTSSPPVAAQSSTPGSCEELIKSGRAELVAQYDCCAGHGGVCGCRAGKIVCCDGSKSDKCGCNKEDPPGFTN